MDDTPKNRVMFRFLPTTPSRGWKIYYGVIMAANIAVVVTRVIQTYYDIKRDRADRHQCQDH